jgi:ethanolamine utilization protein EutN
MYLGRVIGTCVASQKYEGLEGVKLLVVQPLDKRGEAKGRIQVAADTVRAGPEEFVYLVGAREASHALEQAFVPVDAAIVGIVDEVDRPQAGGGPGVITS